MFQVAFEGHELMKAGRAHDCEPAFWSWLHQQGRLAALNEIYDCEVQGERPRAASTRYLSEALQSGR